MPTPTLCSDQPASQIAAGAAHFVGRSCSRRLALGLRRRVRGVRVRRDVRAARRTSTSSSTSRVPTSTRRPSRRPRSSPRAARRPSCPSTRSSRRPRGTSPRSRARSRRPAPTASRSSTRARPRPRRAAPTDPRAGDRRLLGPALKPIALAAVYACRRVDEPADRRHGRRRKPAVTCSSWWPAAQPTSRSGRCCSPTRTRRRASARELAEALWRPVSSSKMPFAGARRRCRSIRLEKGKTMPVARGARLLDCGAHGAAPVAGSGPRSISRSADGSTQEGQRHPGQAGATEERSQVRRGLDRGDPRDPPEYVSTAKVFDMLMAVPKFGRVKASRLLTQCRISQSKTIGGLSDRQRQELIGLFNVAAARPGSR